MTAGVDVRVEDMSAQFRKVHVGLGRLGVTLHHFTGPDVGDHHDHPFPFTTTILSGPYLDEQLVEVDGRWSVRHVWRRPGTSHRVEATDIHRIVELPAGECVTSVVWHDEGLVRRQPRFWRLEAGVMRSRQWDETAWLDLAAVRR